VKLGDALLYVAFFPQLIAGPILRASRFLPQLAVRRNPNSIRLNRAFLLIVGGLFKKVILSNMLATRLVEPVFQSPQSYGAWMHCWPLRLRGADLLRLFRLHGYRHSCALLLGYPLFRANFNAPYTAANPQGVLAAVAYLALDLAARLSLLSAGRIAQGQAADLFGI